MKILYVKNNSERAKAFQLKTIIYEENGQKYIKKQAITKEAIPHLKQMKTNYTKILDSIIDPNVKLAKIIDESEDSLTFEFIEGESLEKKLETTDKKEKKKLINDYISFIKNTTFLFIEASFLNREKARARERFHLTAKQAGYIAKLADAKKNILFHISPIHHGEYALIKKEFSEIREE